MRLTLLSSLGLSLALLAVAEPTVSPYVTHEERKFVPSGWSHVRRHESSAVLPLRFGLTQRNIENIENFLLDVSHPESPNYGKHWSVEKVAATFAAGDETVAAVMDWLVESGIDASRIRVSAGKSWVEVEATVEEAEGLLQTEYQVYQHETGKKHVACERYHLPEHVRPHIDIVTPTVHFTARIDKSATKRARAKRSAQSLSSRGATMNATHTIMTGDTIANLTVQGIVSQLETCDKYMTPDCIRTLYNFFYTPIAYEKNSFGIVEYTPNGYLQSDLDYFFETFDPSMTGSAPNLVSIDGGINTESDLGEPSLDLEYGMILVTGKQNVTLYQVGDDVEGATFNEFLDAIDGSYCTYDGGDAPETDPPYPDPYPYPGAYNGSLNCGGAQPSYVISTSYGYEEDDLGYAYAARQCSEYAKLGLMGITFLFSSGDSGVGGDDCFKGGVKALTPDFPGTCPYITSVGATMVPQGNSVFQPEVAAQVPDLEFWSGGGFSNFFGVPSWQKSAVDYYVKTYPPSLPPFIWNQTGSRAYPDISANGAQLVIVDDGGYQPIWGTSCSAPISGAIFTMINDARLAIGKSPIGFINPTIYSDIFVEAFNDITNGSNPGCRTDGFNATKGWDPVTGLGTPNFPKLLALWLLL